MDCNRQLRASLNINWIVTTPLPSPDISGGLSLDERWQNVLRKQLEVCSSPQGIFHVLFIYRGVEHQALLAILSRDDQEPTLREKVKVGTALHTDSGTSTAPRTFELPQ